MKASERSAQVWAVLAWAARGRQNITYSQLAQVTGAFTGGLGAWLIWQLSFIPAAAIIFHVGMFGLLALAWREGRSDSLRSKA